MFQNSTIKIIKPTEPIPTEIMLPASKSISNRLLIMDFLSHNNFEIENLSTAHDTKNLITNLKKIQNGKASNDVIIINTGNTGTQMRFLTALLAITPGSWLLTGDERMQQRPIGNLVEALRNLGANIQYTNNPGFPPLRVRGEELKRNEIEMDASESSQYISALLMIAPWLKGGLSLQLKGEVVSKHYIEMTLQLMNHAGIKYTYKNRNIQIDEQEYHLAKYFVEPDWSAVSYWYNIVSFSSNAQVFIKDLTLESIQGDVACAQLYRELQVSTFQEDNGITIKSSNQAPSIKNMYDFSSIPDLFPAFVIACAGNNEETSFKGIFHLQYKECNRIDAINEELKKIGYALRQNETTWFLERISNSSGYYNFNTYKDHRMAMAFATLAMKKNMVEINDPVVVNKSYPGFWDDLKNAGFSIE